MLDTLIQDLRYGARSLSRRPLLTAAAVLTLALGIGANTAIFGVVNAVLLEPLPFPQAERIAMIWERNPKMQLGFDDLPTSPGNFLSWREESQTFQSLSSLAATRYNLAAAGEPERVGGADVSSSFFDVMGVRPSLGRPFLPADEQPGSERVAILGHALWQRQFGADPSAVGRTVLLEGEPYRVVGVMPEGFAYPEANDLPAFAAAAERAEVWTPSVFDADPADLRKNRFLAVVGRLAPDRTVDDAQAEMATIARRLEQEFPDTNQGFGVRVVPLTEQVVGSYRPALVALQVAVALVLLIACANIANLLLARASARTREFAIRQAVGASRLRIARQLLTESLLLAVAGGLAGVLVGAWGVQILTALAPASIPRLGMVSIDGAVLGFSVAIAMLAGLVFGIAPALWAGRVEVNESLKEGGAQRIGGSGRRFGRNGIVVAEVALATVLLAAAGLTINSFTRLVAVDPGFEPDGVLTVSVPLPSARYAEEAEWARFFESARERVGALSGVESVGLVSQLPLSGGAYAGGFSVRERPNLSEAEDTTADRRMIDAGYFDAMEIPVLQGRAFVDADREGSAGVAIVSESWAKRFLPDESPIGLHVKLGGADSTRPWLEIVGVAGDVKHTALERAATPHIYVPYRQMPVRAMTLVVRSRTSPEGLAAPVQSAIHEIDPQQPVTDVRTMQHLVEEATARPRFAVALLGVFAVVALLMAAVGIYGVLASSVARRTSEFGVRVALGAGSRDILQLVVRQGMLPVVWGVALGLAGSLAAGRLLASLLFDVSPTDPLTLGLSTAVLLAVALAACYVPARRATRVDPSTALRSE